MISAVLFDLYETLVTERATRPTRASSLGERLELDDKAFRVAWKRQRVRVVCGQVSFAGALLEIGTMLGRSPDPSLVQKLSDERRQEKAVAFQGFDRDAVSVLQELHSRGYKLGIVSNCFAEDVDVWPQCEIAKFFAVSLFSFEVGFAKPEPQIYHEAMRRLGIEGSTAIFVGDGGDDELAGAERAGLRAAAAGWFRGELAGVPEHIPRLSSWVSVLELVTKG